MTTLKAKGVRGTNNAPPEDCAVCLCDIEPGGRVVKCVTPTCTALVCADCFPQLLNHSIDVGMCPTCPSCKEYYLLPQIPKHLHEVYCQAVLKGLETTHSSLAQKKNEFAKKLETLRNERIEFLTREFPPAIVALAMVVCKTKLRTLNRTKRQKIETAIAKSRRTCFRPICAGSLDESFRCLSCDTKFCRLCEEVTVGAVHECKKENLDSIAFKDQMNKCPECLLPIEKSEGCQHMTCLRCKTSFNMSTGARSDHGSYNKDVSFDVKLRKVAVDYADKITAVNPELLRAIALFEDTRKPQLLRADTVVCALAEYYRTFDIVRLVATFCRARSLEIKTRRYYKALTDIESLILSDDLSKLTVADIESIKL